VDNKWDFSKLKHEEYNDSTDFKLEFSKLLIDASSKAPDYHFEIKEAYTFAEMRQITLEATQNLKTPLKKTCSSTKLHV
jgi:hypothetical protein